MAKIAQQDDLVLEITGGISDAPDAVKAKLAKCVQANTVLDVVLKTTTQGVSRVVAYNVAANGAISVVCVNGATGALVRLTVQEAA